MSYDYTTQEEWFCKLTEEEQLWWITINRSIMEAVPRWDGVSDKVKEVAKEYLNFYEL